MNLRQLQAFKIVLDEGSITYAAERFGITQPAMSTLIGKLEDEIGFALFDRHKGRLRATPEAMQFFEDVDQVLNGFDKVVRTARDIRDLNRGQLRIASFPGLSTGLLPRILATFARTHPEVRLSLQTRSSIQVQEWLASQLFDIGIAELPVDHPAIDVEPVSVECVCVLHKDHPLAAMDVLTPGDLARHPFIALNPEHMTHYRLKKAFEEDNVTWRPQIECQLFAPACVLAAQGAGVSLVDPFTAAEHRDSGIVVRPFRPSVSFDVGLLSPSLRPRSRLAREFEALLKKELQKYQKWII